MDSDAEREGSKGVAAQTYKFFSTSIGSSLPSPYFDKTHVLFDFLKFCRMWFFVKCPSKNACPSVSLNASGIPYHYRYTISRKYKCTRNNGYTFSDKKKFRIIICMNLIETM